MAYGYSDAFAELARKRNVPSDLLSADWATVDGWLKERAFFMSGVKDAEILQQFRREAERVARGESGGTEAMNRLWLFLERVGYQPPPGQAGTIKDLSTWKRMSVVLDTNVAMARGYGMWARAQSSLRAFPAWRLTRIAARKKPRDWDARWAKAYALTSSVPGALLEPKVALINHPIWMALSVFGNPYPPYDWNSGMGVVPVKRSESKALGLLDDPRTRPMWESSLLKSPNATTQLTPDVSDRVLREALAERLKGIAEWQGDTLVMTDPNGTRPYTAQGLAELWRRGLPDGLEPRQLEAFLEWVRDSSQFRSDPALLPGTDRWNDFLRFIDRLENERPTETLWRGMTMTQQNLDRFLDAIADGYTVRPVSPAESWSTNLAAVQNYAKWDDPKKWSVVLTVQNPAGAKDITPLVREFESEIGKQKVPSVSVDAEWLYRTGARFRVVKTDENREARQVTITLEELP